jgi:outer membrane protein TolC
VGVIADPELVAAEVQFNGAKANVEIARNDLTKAYISFNQKVGLKPEDKPVLSEPAVFEPLVIQNLEHEVSRVLETSPKVWLAKEMVRMQKILADMTMYTGAYTPYKARKISVEQAELDYMNAKDLFKEITRSLYYTVIDLEEGYKAAQEGLRLAEENLRVKKLRFEVGMTTKSEVTAAELDVANAQNNLNDLAYQHAYLKLAFEKPWAYISAGQ